MRRNDPRGDLRRELEDRIRNGKCVYCRAPAAPDRPLTREHVIPRARGGRRKDHRIIVPACARCNQQRGCQEVVLFLLARPRRLSAFLEYLATLPPEVIREVDLRVYAELFAAVWLLDESVERGREWRGRMERLCAGRRLHRRRYAARRIILALDGRMERARDRGTRPEGPSCPVPAAASAPRIRGLERSCEELRATLVGVLSLMWGVPGERVLEEMARELERRARSPEREAEEDAAEVVSLDGWKRSAPRRRRVRVDGRRGGRRGGRAA